MAQARSIMSAGFSRVDITPPVGVPLGGWGIPADRLSVENHDPVCVRALSLECGGEEALILAFDFCFLGREDVDRLNGVLGRELGLLPRQVLVNASHTHAGPAVGSYYSLYYAAPPRDYLKQVDAGVVRAAGEAVRTRRQVIVRAGMARTRIPLNRRRRRDGRIVNAPNPDGPTLDSLPLCLFEERSGAPVALLFAASTHPVCVPGHQLSADYPGAAMAALDAHLGTPCSLFLQGAGADSRPRVLGEGRENWNHACGWTEAKQVGGTLACDVIAGLQSVLKPVEPRLRTALVEVPWPLQGNLTRRDYEAIARPSGEPGPKSMRQLWAERQIRLDEQGALPRSIPLLTQGIQVGENVRIVALEGELVCELGRLIETSYPAGVTFALGYSNGEGLYLVTSAMLDEGGYEPESYWEYGIPSALAKGTEDRVLEGVRWLQAMDVG